MRSGWRPSSKNLAPADEAVLASLAKADPDAFAAALTAELLARHDAFLSGVEAYRAHPYARAAETPPPVWENGPAKLLDYGVTSPAGVDGHPVLFVPSLVNRSYILDLLPDRSLMRFLASRGIRPLLLDWGTPDRPALARSLDDCIGGTLRDALAAANACAGDSPVPVVGYCMGGTMAVALACLEPSRVSALALLAAPWDFHAGTAGPPPMIAAGRGAFEAILAAAECLPTDAIQMLFFSLDPAQGWTKFRDFSRLRADGPAARAFVALEDWLNDGVPLAAPVARECLFGWYGENTPAAGRWTVCGRTVAPSEIGAPALAVIPASDRIVPPASAAALADALPNARRLSPPGGHIGIMIGRKAQATLWSPLADWLKSPS